jgi:phage tail-like protein
MAADESIRTLSNAAFRFVIEVDGERQAAFTECSLPVVEWDVERIQEGGLNTYVHQLPSRRKPATVTLKNGVGKSSILEWYINTMNESFKRKTVTIILLDSMQNMVMTWHIEEACPLKLTGPQLKTDTNAIAIQSLELLCGNITLS